MPTFDYLGYLDSEIAWPGGPSTGDQITFTAPTSTTVSISDNDSRLQDGTDDRDDEDGNQIATVTDENGTQIDSGQVQPRERIELSDGTNTFYMHRVFIQSSGSYYYIFEDPPPSLNTDYTVTNVSTPMSTNYSALSEEGIACFTRGVMIETPLGARRVEEIEPGDLVFTLDSGPQPVLWHGKKYVSYQEMLAKPGLRPFRIPANAFGQGYPSRTLIFSRQHRVLVSGRPLRRICDSADQLALAHIHSLETPEKIEQICPPTGVEYHHLLLQNHDVLLSHGLMSESLLVTPYSEHLSDILEDGKAGHFRRHRSQMRPALPLLHNKEARRLMRKGRIRPEITRQTKGCTFDERPEPLAVAS
jgi:hypothetical protein